MMRYLIADFVDRILGGDSRPLAACIIEKGGLTPKQVKALEEIIASGMNRK